MAFFIFGPALRQQAVFFAYPERKKGIWERKMQGQEYTGLTEEEFDAMYPNGAEGNEPDKSGNQDQELDVNPGSSSPADFEDPGGHADETMYQGEPKEEEPSQEKVDARGVSWRNRAKELERKITALEARYQQAHTDTEPVVPPADQQSSPHMPPQVELPPPPPPPQTQQVQQQPQQSSQQVVPTTLDEFLALAEQRAEQKALQVMQRQQTEQRILSDYPDISNQQSPLFQWTQYELNNRYGGDSRFVEEAAMRAAARLNIQPKSRMTQTASIPPVKPLPKVTAGPPASERGTPARQQVSKPKIGEEAMRAARIFGQNPKELEAMVKRQKYAYANGESVFEE
jgi:hypothetical protein